MRIMLDTNILISMILFPSEQTKGFERYICNSQRLVLCDYVLEELRLVVDRKFSSRRDALEQFFRELPFELVNTPNNISFDSYPSVRDQKDSPILATAIIENVDVFVTGDKDFLVLDIDSPEIMTMAEFLEKYSK